MARRRFPVVHRRTPLRVRQPAGLRACCELDAVREARSAATYTLKHQAIHRFYSGVIVFFRLIRELGLAERIGVTDEQVQWLYKTRYKLEEA